MHATYPVSPGVIRHRRRGIRKLEEWVFPQPEGEQPETRTGEAAVKSSKRSWAWRATLILTVAIAGTVGVPASQGADVTTVNGFVDYQLAGVPLAPVGVTCPGHPNCYNQAGEPQIAVDQLGRFF